MNTDELEIAVATFVQAVYPTMTVARASAGTVNAAPPYAIVQLISDQDTNPTQTYTHADGDVSYISQRRARIQVTVTGTTDARIRCQRIASRWRADCPEYRAVVASGLGPARADGPRMPVRIGSSGTVQAATVDLTGEHLFVDAKETDPSTAMTEVTIATTAYIGDVVAPVVSVTIPVPTP